MLNDFKRINSWFFLCWLLVTSWLFTSAFLTHGEYGDGYHTIVNARYLFGDSPGYFAQRGPLAAFAMWPVELFIDWIEWNPVDIRPYHFYSALLHSLYLLGCWILLRAVVPRQSKHAGIAQLLAFAAAILTIVFYVYAPYLNHDIIPGFLFLLLIYLCHRWLNEPTIKFALLLVLIGTVVTFIKQTYALFWVTLIIYALVAYAFRWDNQRVTGRKLSILVTLAFISGILSLFGWGLWLVNLSPTEAIIIRPWLLISTIFKMYDPTDQASTFSPDLYLRNLFNYGLCAIFLIIHGLVNAFYSKDTRLRMIAVCWVLSIAFMQFIAFKEVRYLLFLAPLTAALIVPIIQNMLNRRILTIILIMLLLIDQYRGWSFVAKQLTSTAGINIAQFIAAPSNKGRAIISKELSFIYMADSPLNRDPYHGIYHITSLHLYFMHERKVEVLELDNPENLGQMGIRTGDRVYFANTFIIRWAPWSTTNNKPANSDALKLIAGDAERVQLVWQDNRYVTKGNEGYFIMYIPDKDMGQQMPFITSSGLSLEQAKRLYGDIQNRDSLSVIAVIVKGLCQSEQCAYGRSFD